MNLRKTGLASRLKLGLVCALGCGLVLAACSDDEGSSTSNPQTETGGSGGQGGDVTGGSSNATGAQGGAPTGGVSTGGQGQGGENVGGEGGEPVLPPVLSVNSAESLANVSADDYADNDHGIITGATLASYVSDWETNRPSGVTGRLIILQIAPGAVLKHIKPNEEQGVFAYNVPTSQLLQTRDNGLSNFEAEIPDGPSVDKLLKLYDIDPKNDYIALVFEQQAATANSIVQSVGRAWLLLRYWGVDQSHIGILNGSINYNATNGGLVLANLGSHLYSEPPNDGTHTVRDTWNDNTAYVVTSKEIIDTLTAKDGATPLADVRIVDARGGAEAYGLARATSTGRNDCVNYSKDNAKKCSTPFEGRIKGAHSVPWAQFIDTKENGFQFKSKADVKAIFDAQSGWDGNAKVAFQYCRTNQRSTVTGVVANVILGYPTRFYETSFIEWGHLAYGPTTNTQVLPENSPYRTDLDTLTEHAELHPDDAATYVPGIALGTLTQPVTWVDGPNYNANDDISPVSETWPPVKDEPASTNLSVESDRAYIRGE